MTSADENRADSPAAGIPAVDRSVIAAAYAEYYEEMHSFLLGVLRNRELAGEVLQTSFSRALETKNPPREESLRSWLFQVAYREAISVKRRQSVQSRVLDGLRWLKLGAVESSETAASRRELIARVRKALQTLPDEQRIVVRMRIYEEKTFAQIAAELGTPLGTVLTRMRLAMSKLQEQLKTD